jgi:ABC-2 type transport system permease protein
MKNIWLVFKNEFINTITRRSFLLTLILVPLIPALILGVVSLINHEQSGEEAQNIFQPEPSAGEPEGYVDKSRLIASLPAWVTEEQLMAFESKDAAQAAVDAGEISNYYVIESDFLQTGNIQYYRKDFSPLTGFDESEMMNQIIRYNLLNGDSKTFAAFQTPLELAWIDLNPEEVQRDESHMLAFYLPYGVTMLFYVLIISSASLMLNSVAKEKENRVIEILIASLKPKQLFAGKILGLGLAGLMQMVVWMGSAFLMLRLGGQTLNIPPSLQLPPELLIWGLIFFILGYFLYASLMAGVGALVPNVKEATQATFMVILPILIPLLLVGIIINEPHAPLPVVLSLIPFTAPNTLMTRLAVGGVPIWQLLLAMGLMILTILLITRAVAGMFRAQVLLTGKKFSLKAYLNALRGKE